MSLYFSEKVLIDTSLQNVKYKRTTTIITDPYPHPETTISSGKSAPCQIIIHAHYIAVMPYQSARHNRARTKRPRAMDFQRFIGVNYSQYTVVTLIKPSESNNSIKKYIASNWHR